MSSDSSRLDYRDPEWVAEHLGIDKNTVYKYLQDGTIPALQLGRKWLISEARLAQWLRAEADTQTRARREAATSADRTARRMTNLSGRAREVIRLAHAEARRYSHQYLGQEHILLGFAAQPECSAARTMVALGVELGRLREEFESRLSPGETPPPRRLARTPRAKAAMRLAGQQAHKMGSQHVGTEHLLLGILQAGEGAGFEILTKLGLALEPTREEIIRSSGNPAG